MRGKTITEIEINEKASFQKTLTETDVYLFAGITGDNNPAHINQVEAEKSFFKGRIAHGMLSASLISTVFGVVLPGPGTIYLSQELKFLRPVRFGDTITAEVEVLEKDEAKNRIKCRTSCINQNGELIIDGKAEVMPPK